MKIYGYIRVSSVDQNEDRQLLALRELNIPNNHIFIDKQSGKDFVRPSYQRLLTRLREGDLLYIQSIDRLGRNYEEIQQQWRILAKDMGVDVAVLDIPLLDTRINKDLIGTFLSDVVLQLLAFMAQSERESIRKRQAEGIAAAKLRGVKFGRPEKNAPENFGAIVEKWERRETELKDTLLLCGMKETTFFKRLREYREKKQ